MYNKVYQPPRLPQRAVFKPNLQHGRQDSSNFEARTSVGRESKESEETRCDGNSCRGPEEFGETRSDNIDFRIQGLPHSTVRKRDDIRSETVKKLIRQFETHPNRESLMTELDKNQKFNPFNEKWRELIRSMGNTEYFEMCEIISEVQCQVCLQKWEIGIVCCTCGTCLQIEQRSI